MRKVESLCENYTPKESLSHTFKDSQLWKSFTKDHKVFTMELIIIFALCLFLQDFLFTYGTFTSLDNN